MAVVSSPTEVWEARRGSVRADGTRTYHREFLVVTDDEADRENTVLGGMGAAPLHGQHPADAGALCIDRTATQHADSPLLWTVALEYSSRLSDASAGAQALAQAFPDAGGGSSGSGSPSESGQENPLDRPPEINFTTVRYQEALERDARNLIVQNSAGEAYDPPLMADRAHLCLELRRNLEQFDPNKVAEFIFTINQEQFLGFEPEEVLIDDLQASPKWENGHFFWTVFVRFVFSRKRYTGNAIYLGGGWITRLLDAGFMKVNDDGEQERIILDNGQLPSQPVLLNGLGDVLTTQKQPAEGARQYNEFRKYPAKDHNELGLF